MIWIVQFGIYSIVWGDSNYFGFLTGGGGDSLLTGGGGACFGVGVEGLCGVLGTFTGGGGGFSIDRIIIFDLIVKKNLN